MKKEYIKTNDALAILRDSWLNDEYRINRPTLINWISRFKLGYKFAGRWRVDKNALCSFINSGVKKDDDTKKTTT